MGIDTLQFLNELGISPEKILDSDGSIYEVMNRSKKNLECASIDVEYLIKKDAITDYVIRKAKNGMIDPADRDRVKRYCTNLSKFLLNHRITQFYNDPIFSLGEQLLKELFGQEKYDLITAVREKDKAEALRICDKYVEPLTRIYVSRSEFLKMIDFFTAHITSLKLDYDVLEKQHGLLTCILQDKEFGMDIKAKNFLLQCLIREENRKREIPARVYLCDRWFGNNIFDCNVRGNVVALNLQYLLNTDMTSVDYDSLNSWEGLSMGYKQAKGMPLPIALYNFYSALYQINGYEEQACYSRGWDDTINFYKEYAPQLLSQESVKS